MSACNASIRWCRGSSVGARPQGGHSGSVAACRTSTLFFSGSASGISVWLRPRKWGAASRTSPRPRAARQPLALGLGVLPLGGGDAAGEIIDAALKPDQLAAGLFQAGPLRLGPFQSQPRFLGGVLRRRPLLPAFFGAG